MGCLISSNGEHPMITKEQTKILTSTWHSIHGDLEKIGLLMFMGMFDNYPETRQFFGLSGGSIVLEDPAVIQKIREHGLRFMTTARKLVMNLDDKDKFDRILLDLGRRHHGYKADVDLIEVFGQQFIASIQPTLKDNWNPAVGEAWEQLFKCVSSRMKDGFLQAQSSPSNTELLK
ncbi:neuroglobin-like [Saccoglossus kowalevskii]|uniref:Neuroglobin-like n=1 Tax=Saccoglossus kowalevskii TaxID=10224 RepID=A0ABM0MQ47_SACKO|nr:PREDICTED: neuroglobin-like [Saccoglossus kowalevskii]